MGVIVPAGSLMVARATRRRVTRSSETALMNHTSRQLLFPTLVTMRAALAACAPDRPISPIRAVPADGALVDKIDAVTVVSTEVIPFTPNDVLATIGTVNVFNGGFGSAIDKPEGGNTDFYSLTDRGPNIA